MIFSFHSMFDESDSSSYSDELDDTYDIDPTEVYTLEDCIMEDNVLDALADQVAVELEDKLEAAKETLLSNSSSSKRNMERKRLEAQQRLERAISEGTRHLKERSAVYSYQLSILQKRIAKSKQNGKDKVKASVMREELKNTIEAQAKQKQFQLQIYSEKLQSAELEYQAAKENKESKACELESKMLDFYNELLVADTSRMSEDIKVERLEALKCMGMRLFDNQD
jgi:hypothetical protein